MPEIKSTWRISNLPFISAKVWPTLNVLIFQIIMANLNVRIPDLIEKKKDGKEFTDVEIKCFIDKLLSGGVADSQLGAWLMATCINGLNTQETFVLTKAMTDTGSILQWPEEWKSILVDKHSTGGVGDKVSFSSLRNDRQAHWSGELFWVLLTISRWNQSLKVQFPKGRTLKAREQKDVPLSVASFGHDRAFFSSNSEALTWVWIQVKQVSQTSVNLHSRSSWGTQIKGCSWCVEKKFFCLLSQEAFDVPKKATLKK